MTDIVLKGCRPEPLGSYLKALAVLRIVSEQADAEARGWWEQGCLHLRSRFSAMELIEFFQREYRPTPIIAPWNGGSGFYAKDQKTGIEAIKASDDVRFGAYREAIHTAEAIPEVAKAEKGSSKTGEDERRTAILRACRNELPEPSVDWLDAAVMISAEGKRAFSPILGTGGNEGRLDYTNNFMGAVAALLLQTEKSGGEELIRNALLEEATSAFQASSVGQYDPGRAGGFNQGPGIEHGSSSNPWNFVLTLEGTVAWASGIYRKQGTSYRSFLCSPFTVDASAVGYGSAADKDDEASRAEIWAPLWQAPARFAEIKTLLREGRASIDGRPAQTGIEFAQAACSLGVDRGISEFVRYSLAKRRGDSYIALPAGRFDVTYRAETDLVREVTPILEGVERWLEKKPAAYASLRRGVDTAIYDLLLGKGKDSVREVARCLGRLVRWLLLSGKEVRFTSRIGDEWVRRCESTSEGRIAAAVASMHHGQVGAILDNVNQGHKEFAWNGQDLPGRMLSVLERRCMRANALGCELNPLQARYLATENDVSAFLEGDVDDDLIEDLLFAYQLVSWNGTQDRVPRSEPLDPAYVLMKHLFLPWQVEAAGERKTLRADLSLLSLLKSGDVESACEVAIRRLRAAGLAPIEVTYLSAVDMTRLGAALLIPVPFTEYVRNAVLHRTFRTYA